MAINFNFKIQKKDLWLISAIFVFLTGVTYVIAWNSGNPSLMGHSLNEIEICPNGKILKIVSGSWQCSDDLQGAGGGLPSGCSNNQVAKWNGAAWVCANDVDTDTRCDVSGRCAQVCIGTNCRSSWPPSAICTWSDVTYSTGYECYTGTCAPAQYTRWRCEATGQWSSGAPGCEGLPQCGT